MRKLQCIIVEDEPLAMEVLVDYIGQVPFLELVDTYPDALYALEGLKRHSVDVLFLDIHLPKLKGLDFLKTLSQRPQVILTTAYYQYALESYELAVVDYLLKPIDFNRFLIAANKLDRKEEVGAHRFRSEPQTSDDFIFLPTNKKMVKMYFADVLYIESLKDYIRIHTTKRTLVLRMQIGEIEKLLDNQLNILRIHRSYLVAVNRIETFSATEIEVNNKTLPIGRSYKQLVQSKLDQYYKKR